MGKAVGMVIAVVVAAAVAFGAGYYIAGGFESAPTDIRSVMGEMSQAERDEFRNMSDDERQQFFKERGIEAPAGGPFGGGGSDGQGGAPGPRGARVLEGTVVSISGEEVSLELADGGSTTVYVDDETVDAVAQGATGKVVKGAKVLVMAEPETEGVTAAKVIVVTK